MSQKPLQKFLSNLPHWLLLGIVVLWSIVPIYFVISSSFKIPREIFGYPPTYFPVEATLNNFVRLFRDWPEFMRALRNSGIVTVGTILLTITVCFPAAYTFSRYKSPLFRRSSILLIAVRMFPPLIISVPLFPILNQLRLADSHITLVLLYTTFEATIITLIMKSFIDGIPLEIEEAAYVDGATMFHVFTRIILPLSRPVLVGAAILVGSYAWNEFQFGFLFTSTNARTTPVLIAEMLGSLTGVQWGNVFAASVVQFIPALLFLWIIQNQLVRGMVSGATKG
jgi:multiple sugar transport system permease protein